MITLKLMYIENKSQEEVILELLKERKGRRVELPKILKLGFGQYNSRIYGLRGKGHKIINKISYEKVNGKFKRLSFFKLVSE